MTAKKKIITASIVAIILIPLWMFLAWYFTPKTKLVATIIDKTVLDASAQEHNSLTWLLIHDKYTKNNRDLYTAQNDYFGFFPKGDQKFRIKGLERFSSYQIEQLSNESDMIFITDAYGIYSNEWYKKKDYTERSPIVYGGLSQQDVTLLAQMKAQHKLIITEFNSIGDPTPENIRNQFEDLFAMKWTRWTGRYFESFDTNVNRELPRWLVANYKRANGGEWPFKRSGVALVSNSDDVVILETNVDMLYEMPKMVATDEGREKYGLPKAIYYPFWFDIVTTDTGVNKILATMDLGITDKGKVKLQRYNLPVIFPAIQQHDGDDYKFYYFCADFSDNPITTTTAYFKGIEYFNFFMYNKADAVDRRRFFWKVYEPLVGKIIKDYSKQRK